MLWMMGNAFYDVETMKMKGNWISDWAVSFMETKYRKRSKETSRKFNLLTIRSLQNNHRQITRWWISSSWATLINTSFFRVWQKNANIDRIITCIREWSAFNTIQKIQHKNITRKYTTQTIQHTCKNRGWVIFIINFNDE